jgi:rubrerythrin
MAEEATRETLKKAILLEKQSQLFYEKVAAQAEASAVRELFRTLAGEEEKHVQILSRRAGPAAPEGLPVPDTLRFPRPWSWKTAPWPSTPSVRNRRRTRGRRICTVGWRSGSGSTSASWLGSTVN